MMSLVVWGKQWEIETLEDFIHALEVLEENEFCAKMSDDFMRELDECAEISRQRKQVCAMALAKGIV
jgi:hypothetical protein